ncbi:hypothetical protein J2787_000474 [Chryseobacterium rhizosphaerae]|jgi:hypothetical protein|uniref:Lipoprotein n=1 Tax=Chryseobacterium rhizosphaerae TaxID=395937 RepID=A0AAE3Y700_9FLAO|nr:MULTISPECIES: hypothetical protein [Chryseobacterium]MBL3547740.1 hypothetical protein [Chryseobacterium sp. KMC2]MDR6525104.1 hypothetical protein [Chryseobacterium rhizosphaerae]
MKVNKPQKMMGRFLLILLAGSIFLSCKSNDGDDPTPSSGHSIDPATGTFKGTMSSGGQDYYNVIINASKIDDSHIKVQAKAGENYSFITPKVISVQNPVGVGVGGVDNEGTINYLISTKAMQISTKKTSENDKIFYFEGTKQ